MIKVLSNYAPEPLVKALRKFGIIMHKAQADLISLLRLSYDYDIIYSIKSLSTIDRSLLKSLFMRRNKDHVVIYGLHMPMTLDNKVRPTHVMYDVLNPTQPVIASLRGFWIHTLNLRDYRMALNMGLRALYMPLGTDTNIFKCSLEKPNEFTVIYASRPAWHKGTDILVNVIIPFLLKKIKNIRIVITDSNYDYMAWIYEKLKGIPNITLYPHLPLNEYAKVLSEAHVLLFPTRYESYGLVVLDAMATGVIPVSFKVRGFIEDVLMRTEFRDYVVNYPDVHGFLVKVMRLYELYNNHVDKYEKLTIKACNLARLFSWDNVAGKWAYELNFILNK